MRTQQEHRNALRREIRSFFDGLGYTEVDTPIAVIAPGAEVHLDYFPSTWSDHREEGHPLWLRSSPEIHMKRLLQSGMERIYQIGPCFRSGGELARWHHPEFTMLEWYRTDIEFFEFMAETEDLLRSMVGAFPLSKSDKALSLPASFPRMTVAEAFMEFAGIRLIDGSPDLAAHAIEKGIRSVRPADDFETAYFKVLIEAVEPGLARLPAAVLYDYPESQASLAEVEGGVAKRFEVYLRGVELSNGFLELRSAETNRSRFEETNQRRRTLGKAEFPLDEEFLSQEIPRACGNALGFDRLLALLLVADGIDDVIPFRGSPPFGQRPDA